MDSSLLPLASAMVPETHSDVSMDDAESESDSDSELEPHETVDEASVEVPTETDIEPVELSLISAPSIVFETAPDFEMTYDDPMEVRKSEIDDVERVSQQQSRLLTLPTEIFQGITWHMDVGTFFASLLTCRQVMKAAHSKRLLLRHINNIPGLRLGLEDLSTEGLLHQFSMRAAECGCGAGVLADVTNYAPTSKRPVSSAVFSPVNPSEPGSVAQLATVHDGGIIRMYDLSSNQVRYRTELHIRPEDGKSHRMEVLKMAFAPNSRDLAILYQYQKPRKHRFPVSGADKLVSKDIVFKIVTFHRCFAQTKKYFYDSHLQETRDVRNSLQEQPVGFALGSNGKVAISWRNPSKYNRTSLWLIERDSKLFDAMTYDRTPKIHKFNDEDFQSHSGKFGPAFNIQFVDEGRKANLYEPGLGPIHKSYIFTSDSWIDGNNSAINNKVWVDLENLGYSHEPFAIGMPFHAKHLEDLSVDWHNAPVCQTFYLALGMSEYTYSKGDMLHPNVFVMQAEEPAIVSGCDHSVDLDSGRRQSGWKALALLAGWRQGTSSLGTILAISPRGTRIAAATWSSVLIWFLDPDLLHQGELQHYFPLRDYNSRKGFGRLRPTLLSSEGVIHSMTWSSETLLYATTDQGLVKWDIGPMSTGERENLTLAYDAWPHTALARLYYGGGGGVADNIER